MKRRNTIQSTIGRGRGAGRISPRFHEVSSLISLLPSFPCVQSVFVLCCGSQWVYEVGGPRRLDRTLRLGRYPCCEERQTCESSRYSALVPCDPPPCFGPRHLSLAKNVSEFGLFRELEIKIHVWLAWRFLMSHATRERFSYSQPIMRRT